MNIGLRIACIAATALVYGIMRMGDTTPRENEGE